MPEILVLYYSSYGHTERLAQAAAEGVADVPGASAVVKRVPELVDEASARAAGMKLDQAAPLAEPAELAGYDGILFGTPTRFGNMAAQMRNFLDQTGGIWMSRGLVGKVGSVFTSTSSGGGNETTIASFHTTLLHHGMLIAGLPYSAPGLGELTEVRGGSPLGAATIAGARGERQPSEAELELVRFQGRHVAEIARALSLGRRYAAGAAGER